MDQVGPITTDNPTFNAAIEVLRRYHLCHHWGDGSGCTCSRGRLA